MLGWQSSAVSALWKARTRKFKVQSSGERTEDAKRFTPEDSKYFKFYKDVLTSYAPHVFKSSAAGANTDKKFVDIGSAPGGLCKFLITECSGWSGYAFSLSPSEGGLEMKYYNPSYLLFSMANMSKENEWKRMLQLCQDEGFANVDFINCGVVVDYGQVDADGGGNAEMACRSISATISQLLFVLNNLKNGGGAMLIHSISHLDTLFFFLQYLVEIFGNIRVLNTLAPSRSPVYIILEGFKKSSSAEFKQVLSRDGGVVIAPDTIPKWQVNDFSLIERVLTKRPELLEDFHSVWLQKRDCLRETRLFAEKRFQECGSDESKFNASSAVSSCLTVMSGAEQRLCANSVEETNRHGNRTKRDGIRKFAPATAELCAVSSLEQSALGESRQSSAPVTLLTVPLSFAPPSRRKPAASNQTNPSI